MNNQYNIGKFGTISEVKKGFARVLFHDDDIVSNWLPVMVRRSLNDKDSHPYELHEQVFCMMDENCEYGIIQGAVYNDEDLPDTDEGAGKWRKLFSDNSFIEYDKNTHILTANIQGKVKIIATDDIEATSDADIKATAGGNINAEADGDITADAVNIEATASAKISAIAPEIEATAATSATVIAPTIELTGAVNITGTAVITGSLTAGSISTSGAGAITAGGNIVATGNISTTAGEITAGLIGLKTHKHLGVTVGAGTSGIPTP